MDFCAVYTIFGAVQKNCAHANQMLTHTVTIFQGRKVSLQRSLYLFLFFGVCLLDSQHSGSTEIEHQQNSLCDSYQFEGLF